MDSMEWFLGSVAVLTAVLLVGLDTVRSLQRYRVRLGRLLKNLTNRFGSMACRYGYSRHEYVVF